MLNRTWICLLLAIGFAACLLGTSAAVAPFDMQLTPNLVTIGATYNGAEVAVTGKIPADAHVLIEMGGDSEVDTTLMQKEHVFGLLWMNNGTITVSGMPELYQLCMPAEFNPDSVDEHGIGFGTLKKQARIIPDAGEENGRLVDEFFKLKMKEGLYAVYADAITYRRVENGAKSFSCNLRLPSAIRQGTYRIKASVIRGDDVYQMVSRPLEVKEIGLPAMMQSLAFDHGILYGVMATAIAIVAGLLIGFIFRDQGGAH